MAAATRTMIGLSGTMAVLGLMILAAGWPMADRPGLLPAAKGGAARHSGPSAARSPIRRDDHDAAEPPAPQVLVYKTVAPQDAAALNAAMPVSRLPIIAARPFALIGDPANPARTAATDCMTAAIYYEAAGESEAGQRAVAQVVINRLRHPAYPKTLCAVVFQGSDRSTGCQFTFTCDGSLARAPDPVRWTRARRLANAALSGAVEKAVGLATHYHTQWVVPYWRSDLTKLAVIGAHIFYRWQGGWGGPQVFQGGDGANEQLPARLAASMAGPLLLSVPASNSRDALTGASNLLGDQMDLGPSGARPLIADQGMTPVRDAQRPGLLADQTHVQIAADDRRGILTLD